MPDEEHRDLFTKERGWKLYTSNVDLILHKHETLQSLKKRFFLLIEVFPY